MSPYFVVLTNRRRKWDQLMKKQPNLYNNKSRQLKRYVRKGIPGNVFWFGLVLWVSVIYMIFAPCSSSSCRSMDVDIRWVCPTEEIADALSEPAEITIRQ